MNCCVPWRAMKNFIPSYPLTPHAGVSAPRYLLTANTFESYLCKWCKTTKFANWKLTVYDFRNYMFTQ